MAWYNAGNGAGVWTSFAVQTDLKNILHELCTAVNEREMFRASNSVNVSSITRSGSTATATTGSAHALTTGNKVYMCGADQSAYNGMVTVTVTGSTTFTYSVSGSPATPATGTLRCRRPLTKFVYNDAGDTKYSPAVADFVGLPLSKITNGPQRNLYNSVTPTSITSSLGVATVTTTSAFVSSLIVGDTIEVSGAAQSEYNIVATVASKPTSTTFTYAISGSPTSPATGTITVKHHGRLTRSGTTVTVRLPGHGLLDGDSVTISGSTQSEYNGSFTVTTAAVSVGSVTSITRGGPTATVTTGTAHGLSVNDVVSIAGCNETEYNILATVASVPTSTTFTYAVSGSPATPATGSPVVSDETRLQFEITGSPASPGTGDMKLTTNRHLVAYATRSGSTATFKCYDHGFSTGDYVEAIGNGTGDQWAFYNSITVTDSNTFTATITGTPTSPWAPTASNGMIAVTKEGEFRKLLRQLQTAIAALLTASTSVGTIRFVEDSTPYETNYTLANLLGAGSYGSAWVSLHKLPRQSLDDVLDQMREAVDLLVVTTVGGQLTGGTFDGGQGVDADLETAWDEAIADSPTTYDISAGGGYRVIDRAATPTWTVFLHSACSLEFSNTLLAGNFIAGTIHLLQGNYTRNYTPSSDQDTYSCTTSEGETLTLDSPLDYGVHYDLDTIAGETFFDSVAPTLDITMDTPPSSHPFHATVQNASRFIYAKPVDLGVCLQHTRELVPGTHLTYG